mmetsp:Transcript_2582/g.4409  ORF Transcript_2582/g.4409 Transcript_2582/m.4409 type:complete len:94 (-) Transcript_2582:161-442(-)
MEDAQLLDIFNSAKEIERCLRQFPQETVAIALEMAMTPSIRETVNRFGSKWLQRQQRRQEFEDIVVTGGASTASQYASDTVLAIYQMTFCRTS